MLLSSAPGKKAGALAASLAAQTVAIGTLLLIPLLYTDRLPFAQLQLPIFLPALPRPEVSKTQPAPRRHGAGDHPQLWRALAHLAAGTRVAATGHRA